VIFTSSRALRGEVASSRPALLRCPDCERVRGEAVRINIGRMSGPERPSPRPSPCQERGEGEEIPARDYRIAFVVSTSRVLAVQVASTASSADVNFASTNAIVLPICVTLASPTIGPTFAGARKLTVMVMVAV
jgi:hypothetical protein